MFLRAPLTKGATTEDGPTAAATASAIAARTATFGAVMLLALSKLKVDPAVVSAPCINSFVDGTGLTIWFTPAWRLCNSAISAGCKGDGPRGSRRHDAVRRLRIAL
jgi:Mg/Co/Ni transporter MgtE